MIGVRSTMVHLRRTAAVTVGTLVVALGMTPGRAQPTLPPQAQAPAARVLVLPFAVSADASVPGGAGAAFWLGEAAAILIGDGFQRLGGGALTRAERVAAFDRLQLPMSSALTHAAMIRIGELVSASDIVFGEVHLGPTLTVHARMVKLDAGRSGPEVTDQGAPGELFQIFDRVAARLSEGSGRPAGGAGAAPSGPTHPSLEAFENYVKGLVAATPAAQQHFLEAALRSSPRDARVLVALWSVYTAQGAHEKALAAASEVPADVPLARRARFFAALSLIELRRFDGALKAFAALDAERPAAALANAMGVVQLRRGPGAPGTSAVAYFARAVEREPGNTDYLFNLGYANAIAHDAPAALSALRDVVRHDAGGGDAHLVMSAVLAGSGKPVEAGRELELAKLLGARGGAALALSDRVPPGLEHLPLDLDMPYGQRIDAAIGAPAQREQQETAAYHLEQGRRLFGQQSDREATSELRRAIYLSPYEDEPHLLLGRIYGRSGRLTEAIDEFKIAIWCRETVEARVALGSALLQAGDREGARREAARALVLAPDSREARELMTRIGGTGRMLISGHTDVRSGVS